jgi:hypothetical protein
VKAGKCDGAAIDALEVQRVTLRTQRVTITRTATKAIPGRLSSSPIPIACSGSKKIANSRAASGRVHVRN